MRGLAIFVLILGIAFAQSLEKDTRHHFDLAATRAAANFRSADSLESRLNGDGSTLHPQLAALRGRIEAALDEARAEMDKGDFKEAGKTLKRADALLDRFAKKLGGD